MAVQTWWALNKHVTFLHTQHDPSCVCEAWRIVAVANSDSQSLPTLLDNCKTCGHSLEAHVRPVKDLSDEQIDRILFNVYDMDNILLQVSGICFHDKSPTEVYFALVFL